MRKISNSEIQTFKMCPRSWWITWYRGLTPRRAEISGARSIGTHNHLCLEGYYSNQRIHPLVTHSILAAQEIAACPPDSIADLLKDHAYEFLMLEGYMQWLEETGADSFLEILGSEEYLEYEIMPDVMIIGKLDTRVRDHRTGRRAFIDHKNVSSFITSGLRQNPQMLHYHLLETRNTPAGEPSCEGAYYNMIKKSKRTAKAAPPFYQREFIPHNRYEIANYETQLRGVISDIMAKEEKLREGMPHQEVVYPNRGQHCDWKCPAARVCPLFDDGSRAEDMLAGEFVAHDTLSYYGGKEVHEQ